MKMETIINKIYVCGECHKKYNTEKEALKCEEDDKKIIVRENIKIFVIKEEHLKLLKEMCVRWNDCEFGAPEIDPKRPYGNSNVVYNVAEIIGIEKTKDNTEYDKEEAKEYSDYNDYITDLEWNKKTYDYLFDLHKDMQIVLQIVLSTLSFQKGTYRKKNKYGHEWVKV